MAFSSRLHEASHSEAASSQQQQHSSLSKHGGLHMSRSGSVASGLTKAGSSQLPGSVNNPFGALKRSTTQASGLSSKSSNNTVKRQLLPSSKSKEDIWGTSWKSSSGVTTSTTQHRSTTPPLSPGTAKSTQPVQQRPTMTGLRSPPPLAKSLKPKRSIDAGESDRPAKRPALSSALTPSPTFSSGLSRLTEDAAITTAPDKPVFKARRSIAIPSSRTSSTLSSLQNTGKAIEPTLVARRTSNIFAQSSSSLAPLASSSSTLSFSPSKFGLTVPRELNFSVSPKDKPKPLQAEHHNNDIKARGLAPSPLQPNEHVPRPIAPFSASTTPQKPVYGASSIASPLQRSGQDGSLKSFDLMQRTIEKNKEDRTMGMMIISPSRGSHGSAQSLAQGPRMTDTIAAPPKLQLPILSSITFSSAASSSSAPKAATGQPFLLPSIRLHPDESEEEQPSTLNLAPPILPICHQQTMPSSPLKRPRSPSPPPAIALATGQAGASRSIKPRRSMITRSLSAGEIARQAVREDEPTARSSATVAQQAPAAKRRVLGHGLPRAASSRNVGRMAAASAQASESARPPVTTARSVSAPIPRRQIPKQAEDANAMEVLSAESDRKEATEGANVSEDSLEMDTSIMSSSGQASLANLQSLLSRMSIPRASMSRRSSANNSTLHLLDERAEIEQEMLASGNVHPDNTNTATETKASSISRAVPRYAAPTTSSTARFALSYTNPGVPVRSTYTQQKQKHAEVAALGLPVPVQRGIPTHRKISNPPPGAVRGSLLPLASSTSAAQNAIKRSSSSPTKEMDVDKPKSESVGEPMNKPEKSTTLKDVVAFVDVKTAEGDDAGGVFVDILRSLGARVLARPTDSVTHIIYKGGRASTLTRYRAYRDPKPHLVGVGWVVACRETDTHTSEKKFMLDANGLESVLLDNVKSKNTKRKSLEPRRLLSSSTSNMSLASASTADVFQHAAPNVLQPVEHNAQPEALPLLQKSSSSKNIFGMHLSASNAPQNMDIDRARRRTLQFAPKIGSPLKQRVFNAFEVDEDAFADDD